ncbi:uncharacterized protein LOC119984775 isoform X2 [Tripterygium wilfordii]|uniref:uncharacterized protein LOC119984775 isoform X2 n=1 Tax=Tripterygium wilfordii TaxID=458696 RepID=UPI0018F7E698|nr:uncharacterized protein LOC119984775 isoform X2 [Tripterygium wilfordii]
MDFGFFSDQWLSRLQFLSRVVFQLSIVRSYQILVKTKTCLWFLSEVSFVGSLSGYSVCAGAEMMERQYSKMDMRWTIDLLFYITRFCCFNIKPMLILSGVTNLQLLSIFLSI